jgi:hypothetical protein
MWGGALEDIKMSYAPQNVRSGSLISCVAGPKPEKIKITAKVYLYEIMGGI